MEILTAYVRANAPWRGKADEAEEKRKGEEGKSRNSLQFPPAATLEIRAPDDIQAILTVLARRTLEHEEEEDRKLNLSETDLGGLNISRGFLDKAILLRANLQKAYLMEANLQEAIFWQANLQEAILGRANLYKANFNEADLQKAILIEANLQKAYLRIANLQKAYFMKANLQEADFWEANLRGAKGLTVEQLSKVKTLYEAELDPNLMEEIKENPPIFWKSRRRNNGKTIRSERNRHRPGISHL